MNKKYKKILATGLALNMMLVNIPYNVFANSDMIENTILSEEDIPLIGEQSESGLHGLVNQDEQASNDESLISDNNEESDSNYINEETIPEFAEPIIKEGNSNIVGNDIDKNVSNSVTDFAEDEKSVKSIMPSITNYADSFAGGDGSEENPYQISNALELARLAYLVNEEGFDTTDMYFELTDDIDLDGFDSDNDLSNGNWIPIGYTTGGPDYLQVGFKGIFNGNDYTVYNISVGTSNSTSSGFFAFIENASIKNLNINNIHVDNSYNVGSLIGYINVSADLENINIIEVNIAKGNNIGGIAGYMYGTSLNVKNCSVTSSKTIGSSSSGVVGGLIGYMYGFIEISNINIEVNLSGTNRVGGLIASYNTPYSGTPIFSIDNIMIKSNIDLNFNASSGAGLIAYCYLDNIPKNMTLSNIEYNGGIINTKSSSYASGLISHFSAYNYSDSHILNVQNIVIKLEDISGSHVGGLMAYCYTGDTNIDNIAILISGEVYSTNYFGGLIGMSSISRDSFLKVSNYNFTSKNIIKSDNNVGGVVAWCDTYLSLNNVNINFNVEAYHVDTNCNFGGITGYLATSQKFKNVDINNANISMNATAQKSSSFNQSNIGGYVAQFSTFSNENNCFNVRNSSFIGNLKGKTIGGLIGYTYTDYILNIENFYSIGDKYATNLVGILIGENMSNNIKAIVNMTDSYMVGNLKSDKDSIYLIPNDDIVTVNTDNVYYDKTLCSFDDKNLIGLTTEQMQGYPTYENMDFDFESIWKANRDYYPTFKQLNTAPELSGEDIELIQNQEYSLLDYVTVEDFEDKDLIPEVETDLDITKIGNYTATFTVADPQGLSDELTLNIKVIAERPVINAKDLTLYVGDKFNPLDKVTAIDINGNDITKHIKVIENTVDTTKKGIYKVVYQVDSLEKLSTTKEIKVTVLEKENNNNNNDNKVEIDKNESSTTDKPQTGDNFIVYRVSILTCLIGLLYINRKSKKED